jgi:hypothetical protein
MIKDDEQEAERGNFKEILGQIDEYVQSLLDKAKESSQAEDEVEEAAV